MRFDPPAGVLIRSMVFVLGLAPFAAGAQSSHGSDHHPRANAALMAFHDIMEPFWHGTPGAELNRRACGVADEINRRAKAVAGRPTADHGALLASAKSMTGACERGDEAATTAELGRLHEIFHRLASGG